LTKKNLRCCDVHLQKLHVIENAIKFIRRLELDTQTGINLAVQALVYQDTALSIKVKK